MADEELAALADVVGILLDDLRRQRAAQQAQMQAQQAAEQPRRDDEATKTLNQDHHKGSPNGQPDRNDAR